MLGKLMTTEVTGSNEDVSTSTRTLRDRPPFVVSLTYRGIPAAPPFARTST
jgi:hypothetical protein